MNFKLLPLTFFFVLGFTFSNCDDDCGCGDYLPFLDVVDLTAKHHRFTNGDDFEEIDMFVSYPFDSYAGILANLDFDFVAMQQDLNWNFSTIPEALSCSCLADGFEGVKEERFTKFEVITAHDYDDQHLANSSINSLMSLRIFEYGNLVYSGMLDDYLEERSEELIDHDNFLLKPLSAPSLDNKMQLLVRMELSNGEVYEVLTEEMEFL